MYSNKFHHYNKDRSKNYNYIDRAVRLYVENGGALFHIHKLLATKDSEGNEHPIEDGVVGDSVLNENPYRKYSKEVFDLWGVTKMNPPKFSFNFDGLSILDGDEREITLHYNSMIAQLNRKIIIGDVVEFTWIRDIDILGTDRVMNKFYQVTESARDDNSWDATYKFHLWKLKVKPIPFSTEFQDLVNNGEENTFYEDLGSINGGGGISLEDTTAQSELDINDKILQEAEENGPSFRLHDEHHVFLNPMETLYDENGRFIPDGIDGIAKELNCEDIEYGEYFPNTSDVKAGDYFIRTDYNPPRLFKREYNEDTKSGKWVLQEFDNREQWTGAPQIVRRPINMVGDITLNDGSKQSKQQNIKDLVKARVKKEHNNPKDWNKITLIKKDSTPTGI